MLLLLLLLLHVCMTKRFTAVARLTSHERAHKPWVLHMCMLLMVCMHLLLLLLLLHCIVSTWRHAHVAMTMTVAACHTIRIGDDGWRLCNARLFGHCATECCWT